jgi:hypothetical protein
MSDEDEVYRPEDRDESYVKVDTNRRFWNDEVGDYTHVVVSVLEVAEWRNIWHDVELTPDRARALADDLEALADQAEAENDA